MKILVFVSLVGFAASLPQGYNLPVGGGFTHGGSSGGSFGSSGGSFGSSGGSFGSSVGSFGSSGGSFSQGASIGSSSFGQGSSGFSVGGGSSSVGFGGGVSSGGGFGSGFGGGGGGGACGGDQVRVGGRCVTPRVNRRVFLYDVPRNVRPGGGPVNVPEPTVETNIIFIRTPEGGIGQEPIVVPPPQQRHVVYVLNKQSAQDQRVIEVPSSGPQTPEVYFVNYADGENPTLPSGVDLQTALQSASQGGGQQIGSAGSGFSSGGSASFGGSSVSSGGSSFGGSGISSGGSVSFGGSGISSGGSVSFGGSGISTGGSSFGGSSISSGGSSVVSQPSGLYSQP